MLLNKFVCQQISIGIIILLLISCSEKKEKIPVLDYNNKAQLLEMVKKHYNPDAVFAFGGIFDDTGRETIAVGTEVENNDNWGIKFILLKLEDNEFVVKFETDLLDGSFKESFVNKIKFSSFEDELLYYNSQSYFMGSGGGEIFSYIIDFNDKLVYYAHLVVDPTTDTSLFISDNTDNKEIKNFFNLNFKKDYPNLKLVSDDIFVE